MNRTRMLLLAASAAALALPMGASVTATAATAGVKMINGKPCVPVPGGSSRLGIQLFSLPGLLQGTATNIEAADAAYMAGRGAGGGRGGGGGPGGGGAPGAGGGGGPGGGGAPGAGGGGGPGGGGAPGAAGGPGGAAAGGGAPGAGGAAAGGRGAGGGAGAGGGRGGAAGGAPAAARGPTPLPDGSAANMALVDSTFAWLKSQGYSEVERAGYYGMSPLQLRGALAKAGLTVVGGHDQITAVQLDNTIAYALTSGQNVYVGAASWMYGNDSTPEGVKAAADGLNEAGKRALAQGLHLYVHNHTGEFNQVLYDINHNGKPILVPAIEALIDQTDPRYLNYEIDVHWIIAAYMGAPYNQPAAEAQKSALAFVKKHVDRVILLHVKETDEKGGEPKIGQGITDWPAWWAVAKNVKYYIYEMDGPPDPVEYARIAANYLLCRPTT